MIIYITYDKNSESFTQCQSDGDDPSIAEVSKLTLNFKKFSSLEEGFLQANDLPGVDII